MPISLCCRLERRHRLAYDLQVAVAPKLDELLNGEDTSLDPRRSYPIRCGVPCCLRWIPGGPTDASNADDVRVEVGIDMMYDNAKK